MIVGDLGSVILSQAFNITVSSARFLTKTLRRAWLTFCFSIAFTDDASSGDFRLDVYDLLSIEPLGKIRSFNADIHSIDCLLPVLLHLCKWFPTIRRNLWPRWRNSSFDSCRQWLSCGSIHRWACSTRIKWSIGGGLAYSSVYPSCHFRSPVKRKSLIWA